MSCVKFWVHACKSNFWCTTIGSVLLSLCYINDITQNLTSQVRLYADDTLIIISNEKDVAALQKDLNTIMKWSIDWQMTFNPNTVNLSF